MVRSPRPGLAIEGEVMRVLAYDTDDGVVCPRCLLASPYPNERGGTPISDVERLCIESCFSCGKTFTAEMTVDERWPEGMARR